MPVHVACALPAAACVLGLLSASVAADPFVVGTHQFVNWESPHVHPVDLTPDGHFLLAVNTADNRLEVFDASGESLIKIASIPVGLDPISVRARNEQEAWVVNRISDSVSVVNLETGTVRFTLQTQDEPADVVFAGQRALVSCSQANTVLSFDPDALELAPAVIQIEGLRPSAMAVSPDGLTAYVAILESGNGSTILNGGNFVVPAAGSSVGIPPVVNDSSGPHAGTNPPFNGPGGTGFSPALDPNNLSIPVGLIVRRKPNGSWADDTGADWSSFVTGVNAPLSGRVPGWTVVDQDVAAIDAQNGSVTHYYRRAMTMCMALGVHPTGNLVLVGTEAHNERRFESNLKGSFMDVTSALLSASGQVSAVHNLNPQLLSVPPSLQDDAFRFQAIGDPRAVAFEPSGERGFVAGMGSNNLVMISADGQRVGEPIPVGRGPTGIAIAANGSGKMYVLNRFDATISVVDTTQLAQVQHVPLFDPTPPAVKVGRRHLYDTHASSFSGHLSCGSCHVDSRFDRLAWDLGDPSLPIDPHGLDGRNLGAGIPLLSPPPDAPVGGLFNLFTQMKGPMTTQTLQDIIGNEPFHWRGDRKGIEEFNSTFVALLGNDSVLSTDEMQAFEDFLATITFPPNPFRNFDNTLPQDLPLPGHFSTGQFSGAGGLQAGQPLPSGNAQTGLLRFTDDATICQAVFTCVQCHSLPTGAGPDVNWNGTQYVPIPPGPDGEHHRALIGSVDGQSNDVLKAPHLRNQYQKIGMNFTQVRNLAGFGYNHDGSIDSIERFVGLPFFNIIDDQDVADITAFLLAFSGSDLPEGQASQIKNPPGGISHDTHAAVGKQLTIAAPESMTIEESTRLQQMIALASAERVGLVAKGLREGQRRGWEIRTADLVFADRFDEQTTVAELLASSAVGSETTFTVVVRGTARRIGIDHDLDGILDFDDPIDGPNSLPCPADFNQSGTVSVQDIFDFLAAFFANQPASDFNASGQITVQDIFDFLAAYFTGCP